MSEGMNIENGILKSISINCKSVSVPAEVTRIGKEAFKGSSISSITFNGNNLKSIDDNAFKDCVQLQNIMIPDGVVQIGDYAFSGCLNLNYIGIPASVVLTGEDILENCKKDLFIIGKENTEAAKVAEQYNYALIKDPGAIRSFEKALEEKNNIETKSFNVFGETITCSNTLLKYHKIIEYFVNRKEPFFQEFSSKVPKTLSGQFGNVLPNLENEERKLISRLSSQGVFVKTEDLVSYKYTPYQAMLEVLQAVKNAYESIHEDLTEGIKVNTQQLINEAESKVTGLSYGFIGDGLDMIAYSFDELREKKRQRTEAYAVAEKKSAQYIREQTDEGNKIYSEFITKALPILHQGTDLYLDGLCKAEIDLLSNAGLIDSDIERSIDIKKSSELMNSIINKTGDNSFTVALALKQYPCNIAAHVYAEENGYSSQELTDLRNFLGIESTIKKEIEEKRQKAITEHKGKIQALNSGNAGVRYIRNNVDPKDEELIKILLSNLSSVVYRETNHIISSAEPSASMDARKYSAEKMNDILSSDSWSYFNQHSVDPVTLPGMSSVKEYSDLIDAVSCKVEAVLKRKEEKSVIDEQNYLSAKEQLSNAKTISDYEQTAVLFKKLGGYKDCNQIYKEIEEKIKGKKRFKKWKPFIFIASGVVVLIIALCIIVSVIKNAPNKELKNAIYSGQFSKEWHDSKGNKFRDGRNDLKTAVNVLSEYHSNDNVEGALALMTTLMECGIEFDGDDVSASISFIDWIKDAAVNEGTEVKISKKDYVGYNIYGYQLTWNSNLIVFYLYVPSLRDDFLISNFKSYDHTLKIE